MSVAKTIEITAESSQSFEEAIQEGIARASRTVNNVKSAWVCDHEVSVSDGQVTGYKVRMKVTFVLD